MDERASTGSGATAPIKTRNAHLRSIRIEADDPTQAMVVRRQRRCTPAIRDRGVMNMTHSLSSVEVARTDRDRHAERVHPPDIAPQLASSGLPRSIDAWTAEPKLDGWRARVAVHNGTLTVRTRGGHDVAASVPHLDGLAAAGVSAVLDGELVAGSGRAEDFYLLAAALARKGKGPVAVTFVAFDVLWSDGELLTGEAQRVRRGLLDELRLAVLGTPVVPSFSWEDAPLLFTACSQLGAEGMVLKDSRAIYRPGVRSTAWRKAKVGAWREHLERRFAHRLS